MLGKGQDIITIGSTRVGQRYILGANVPLDNPNWRGPWDCAEFASWCAYQAYGLIFGAGGTSKVSQAEPYSGYWYDEAMDNGEVIDANEAFKTPGAILLRKPGAFGIRIGHVAISMGDNSHSLEARDRANGVGKFSGVRSRSWSIGLLLPGVDYGDNVVAAGADPVAADLPDGFLHLKKPNFKGPVVVALQLALVRKEIDPGPIDGEFGPMTSAAVVSLQVAEGLEVDGVVGPLTAAALQLGFPIVPKAADIAVWENIARPTGPGPVIVAPTGGPIDTVVEVALANRIYRAKTSSGFSFMVGSRTQYTDDMTRTGLFQGPSVIADSKVKFGTYDASEFVPAFGKMAHFIGPTLTAEGGGPFFHAAHL